MTDHSATPAPTGPTGDRSWRIPLLVGALVLVIVVVVAALVAGGGDDSDNEAVTSDPTAASPTASASETSASATPSTVAPSESASVTPTPEGDPVISPVINKAVKAAIRDDFPALVPSGVPAGWTVVSAAYSAKQGGRWTIELTDPSGAPVGLVQTSQSVEELVSDSLSMDMQPSGTVNLGDYGTGEWTLYTGATAAIATTIADTAALVSGTDQETVVELAQQLLTAEDADLPEAG